MISSKSVRAAVFFFLQLVLLGPGRSVGQVRQIAPGSLVKRPIQRTPETLLGERLTFESRFAQYFAANSNGDVNAPLAQGDPVVVQVLNPRAGVPYPSTYAGKSIACRSCHFVDEYTLFIAGENRTYADYLARSPMPNRGDGAIVTTRNARNMVDDFTPRRSALLLHADGEFPSPEVMIKSALADRVLGWLPNEHDQALHHIAKVIREDDGHDELGKQYGGSYAKVMLGTAADIPDEFRLSNEYRIDVATATDDQIIDEVARLISVFLRSLRYEQTAAGLHTGSAYDMFLAKNNLPALPAKGESDVEYSQKLLQAVEQLQKAKFVLPYERWLRFHPHVCEFGPQELAGLKLFLRMRTQPWPSTASGSVSHTGNCALCHPAPDFTDMRFHNTGAAQEEYDSVHGVGSFEGLPVPSHAERSLHPEQYLPATHEHPNGTSIFRAIPSPSHPLATDLGLWNVYANADYPDVQGRLNELLCGAQPCDPNLELPKTIACFRTPTLRDLGHSWPYLHNGRMATIEDMLRYYVRMSDLARKGRLRNGAPELSGISLDEQDLAALAAFLRSLDEDYDN